MRAVSLGVLVLISVSPSLFAASLRAVVPVVGSTQGAFGSHFKTSLQIHNRSEVEMRGKIVIHPAGVPATESDPSLPYVLAPHQTVSFDDVVADLGLTGLGSMDFVVEAGGVPTIVARAYDEKGEAFGTTGVSVRAVSPRDALVAGEAASLLAPPDLTRFRFNIGIRTLDRGARMRIVVRDATGVTRAGIGEASFPANYFIQRPAREFLAGVSLDPNWSVSFEMIEGAAILYGTATDNTTNDSSLQIIRLK
jgi:hypothetical protein